MNSASSSSCYKAPSVNKNSMFIFPRLLRLLQAPFGAREGRSCHRSDWPQTSWGSPGNTPPCCPPSSRRGLGHGTPSHNPVLNPDPRWRSTPPGFLLQGENIGVKDRHSARSYNSDKNLSLPQPTESPLLLERMVLEFSTFSAIKGKVHHAASSALCLCSPVFTGLAGITDP